MFYIGAMFVGAGIQQSFPIDRKEFSEARRSRQPPRGCASRLRYSHEFSERLSYTSRQSKGQISELQIEFFISKRQGLGVLALKLGRFMQCCRFYTREFQTFFILVCANQLELLPAALLQSERMTAGARFD